MLHLPTLPLEDAAWLFLAVMTAILVAPILARWLRIPQLVTLVLVGMLAGPGVLGLLEREGPLAVIGEAGLLYLMFVAGLELDLHEFVKRRTQALVFGLSGFLIPMLVGTVAIAAMGFPLLAAVLLASCWASHTLLTYPTFRAHGTATNAAVSTSVGATILTDTAALVVLVVVLRAHAGQLGPALWLTLAGGFLILAALTVWVLPRVGRAFFATYGVGRNPRFVFAMLALFGTAAFGEVAGIEPIVGAFLAGIGLNRLIPAGSPLMRRIEFVGDAFLIPAFLLTVGLLIDPAMLVDPRVLGMASGFIAVALGSKFLAAYGTGRLLGFDRQEWGAMAALTSAQAAATLAAAMVGLQAEIIDAETLNAVVVVILVTCLVSAWLADRVAPRLSQATTRRRIGERVIVPIADPGNADRLVALASLVAAKDGGLVVPVTVAPPEAGPEQFDAAADIARDADRLVQSTGGESAAVVRLDASPSTGILNAMVEQRGTMLVLGWEARPRRGRTVFGTTIDSIVTAAPAPILVGRLDRDPWQRLVVLVAESNLHGEGRPALRLAIEVVRRIRDADPGGRRPAVEVISTVADDALQRLVRDCFGVEVTVDPRRRTAVAADVARPGHLIVVPFRPERHGLRGAPRQLAEVVGDTPFLAVLDHAHRRNGDERARAGVAEPGHRAVDERLEDAIETVTSLEAGTPAVGAMGPGQLDTSEIPLPDRGAGTDGHRPPAT
ncbi:cation:proton antiporter [Egicoccus sp. AB-alg2]|uniref:cation:proton antiporter n=1 Tax=Egicoccus sp. AB-alg2 TaxID=3242693 RepID=UPI00359E5A76